MLPILNSCYQSTASLFGPSLTIAKTGNLYHAGLSYTSSKIMVNQLGITPGEYLTNVLNQNTKVSDLLFEISGKKKFEKKSANDRISDKKKYEEFLASVKMLLHSLLIKKIPKD